MSPSKRSGAPKSKFEQMKLEEIERESLTLGVPVLADLLEETRGALVAGEDSRELAVRLWPRFVQAVTIAAAEVDSRRGVALLSWLNRPREEADE